MIESTKIPPPQKSHVLCKPIKKIMWMTTFCFIFTESVITLWVDWPWKDAADVTEWLAGSKINRQDQQRKKAWQKNQWLWLFYVFLTGSRAEYVDWRITYARSCMVGRGGVYWCSEGGNIEIKIIGLVSTLYRSCAVRVSMKVVILFVI